MDYSQKNIATPDVALLAMTRVILGVGMGLLLSRKLSDQGRIPAGLALITVGVATTVPLAIEVFGGQATQKVIGPA